MPRICWWATWLFVFGGCAVSMAVPDPEPPSEDTEEVDAGGASSQPRAGDASGADATGGGAIDSGVDAVSLPSLDSGLDAVSLASKDAPSFTPAACNEKTAVFCDGFESGLNAALRRGMSGGATIAVDSTRARGGQRALHVKSQMPSHADATVSLDLRRLFPAGNSRFYLRVFVYYARPVPSDNLYLFRLDGVLPGTTTKADAHLGGEGYPYGQPTAAGFKNLTALIYQSDIPTANHIGVTSRRTPGMPALPLERWACWEWQVDATRNEWRLWVDEVEHFTVAWNGKPGTAWVVPTFNTLLIGTIHAHTEPAATDVWYDDLVIATDRVGCGAR